MRERHSPLHVGERECACVCESGIQWKYRSIVSHFGTLACLPMKRQFKATSCVAVPCSAARTPVLHRAVHSCASGFLRTAMGAVHAEQTCESQRRD